MSVVLSRDLVDFEVVILFFFFKQKTAYEMRISDWSSDVCSSDLISGEMGDKIKQLPFIGIRLERYLAAKARRAQDMEKKLPGTFTAIVMYLLSLWRVAQLRRLMRLSQDGVLVIADRYPQAEIPGFNYDGPGLTAQIGRAHV